MNQEDRNEEEEEKNTEFLAAGEARKAMSWLTN